MGYRSPIHRLDLPAYRGETDADSLIVRVVPPNVREAGVINAGQFKDDEGNFVESRQDYSRRVMTLCAMKIREWNLEDVSGRPIELPREVRDELKRNGVSDEEADRAAVDHFYEIDENIVLAIYQEWRLVGMPKPENTGEGKDSGTPSTPGPDESSVNGTPVIPDLRELEAQIPMG